ncbi:sentrin-specific protease [Drosophila innubila]|uniref:sentrin-specific protease n=1 Tax=Drosophila innubila TaxID=198719 RepID=UPI00148C638E|nr:sentrin-specific protease [Drosophila innubila]XP_034489619.1 sentrin-specific protease [Drosophila innubila]
MVNGIGLPHSCDSAVHVTNGVGPFSSISTQHTQQQQLLIDNINNCNRQQVDYDYTQQYSVTFPITELEQRETLNLDFNTPTQSLPDRRLETIQRALDLIYEIFENLQPDRLLDILLLQRKLNDVRDYLLAESQEISPAFNTALLLNELDQILTAVSSKIDSAISNHDSMGFDLLSKIRHWFLPAGRNNAKDSSNPSVDEIESNRKRCHQSGSNEATAERLIKYRRVDNTFPKYMPNDVDDYSHMADPKQRKDQDSNTAMQCQPQKRLSIFSAPQTRQVRVRNNQTTAIDLSDCEEQEHSESNMYQAFSDRLGVDVPGMSRDFGRVPLASRPLYSDAVRYSINGFGGDLNYPRPSSSPSSSEARLNGHANHIYDSSANKDNLLALEDQRNERNQYINLINNLTLREHEPTPRRSVTARGNEKPPTPPGLQRISDSADDWLRGLIKNKPEPEPRAQFNFNRSEYSKLLDSKSRNQYEQQHTPAIARKPPPELVKCYNIDSSVSGISFGCEKPVITITDDDHYGNITNKSQLVAQSSALISRPLTKALQQRQSTCIYLDDNYAMVFNEKCARAHEQSKLAKQLVLEEAKKTTEDRRSYEQQLREKLTKRRLIGRSILLVDSFLTAEDAEPEILPFTEEHQQRYNELVHGPAQMVLVSKFSLNITRNDIRTLIGSCWLNDEIINFYMNLITDRSQNKQGKLPSVYAMNTFFIPRLLQNGHSAVKRWTRKVDLFSKDIIPVPVHVGGVHWCMAIIHMKNKTIRYYDSMGKPNQMVLNALETYLREESLDKRKLPFDTSDFKIENVQNVPQQTNGSDCGVFSCMFAEYITRNKPLNFSQEHMEYFRKKMVLEICSGELWM